MEDSNTFDTNIWKSYSYDVSEPGMKEITMTY